NVAQDTTFTTQRLREQETGCALDGQGGGVELHELEIREHCSGVVGDGHAVAGGPRGIGGLAIDLAEPAGSKQHRAGMDVVCGVLGPIEKTQPSNAAVLSEQFDGEGVRADLDALERAGLSEQRTEDLSASGITLGMENARATMRTLAREGEPCSGAV